MAEAQTKPFSLPSPGICISAVRGGGGKTLISLGLCRALVHKGFTVKAFKKGPDYIDAAWLARASKNPATNLDLFFLPPHKICELAQASLAKLDSLSPCFALLEGNRGLYDGQNSKGAFSTAELSRILNLPILLVIDVTKVTRTAAAVISGLTHFEPGLRFTGCVLNRVGTSRQEALLRTCIEEETGIPVLGAIPRLSANPLPERHMGLASYGAKLADDTEAKLEGLANLVETSLDLAKLMERCTPQASENTTSSSIPTLLTKKTADVRIGFLRDEAFWFYYEENLEALANEGVDLVPLRLLGKPSEPRLWQTIHGLYLGGGFPEDFASELAASPDIKRIAELSAQGLPIYAECGGFMLLARSLCIKGQNYPMCNVFPVDVEFCPKPQGLGYVQAKVLANSPFFTRGEELRGHEFHYSRCVRAEDLPYQLRLSLGHGMSNFQDWAFDGLCINKTWASYMHLFAPAYPAWARHFAQAARQFSQNA